jgi:dienelactone hydrolase
MKKTLLFGCALVFLSAGFATLKAQQSVILIDTVYTPPAYSEGPLWATIYLPAVRNGVGVILAHGYSRTRKSIDLWCDTLATRGYLAMAIDYYDAFHLTYGGYPKAVRAFKTAVEFLRRNAVRFGITTDKVFGLGASEGAIHWAQSIIWDNDDAYFGTDPAINDRLDAAVLLYGLFDNNHDLESYAPLEVFLSTLFAANPALRSTKGNCIANVPNITVPVLLVHGTSDMLIEAKQSMRLYDSLSAHGKMSQLKLFTDEGHEFDLSSPSPPHSFTLAGLVAKDTVLAFFQRVLSRTSAGSHLPVEAPGAFALFQNYPNPFNTSTVVNYQLPAASEVRLVVYDLLGREVVVLVNERKLPGSYAVKFDAGGLSSGVYFYKLSVVPAAIPALESQEGQVRSFVATRRLLFLR